MAPPHVTVMLVPMQQGGLVPGRPTMALQKRSDMAPITKDMICSLHPEWKRRLELEKEADAEMAQQCIPGVN